ncbi:cation-transporting P-type ATPase [Crystallibacter degradans]|uniref:cation-transporting P-type ATPase n=1 Tax=Crystallibacter degradans TaxID=2726743 RepID=UPI00197C436E|nr:cation-transporting P-type ATPase [Arthrobacter sp. SF27]
MTFTGRPVEPIAWHLRAAADALVAFRVDPAAGLDSAEAERRLQTDGPNELRTSAPVPRWRKILAQFQDPLIYLLLVAIAISLGAWAVNNAGALERPGHELLSEHTPFEAPLDVHHRSSVPPCVLLRPA